MNNDVQTESARAPECDLEALKNTATQLPTDGAEALTIEHVPVHPELKEEHGNKAHGPARNAAAGGPAAYTRFVLNVVPFAAADQAHFFSPQHLQDLSRLVQDVVNWCNLQVQRVAPNVSFVHDNGAQRFLRSKRSLAWFQAVNADVLNFWKPYPLLATQNDIKEYNTQPASRQRWWMNVLADLATQTKVHLNGSTQVTPTIDVGKSMALHSRTVVLCAFGTPPNNGGAVAPARTAMISQDALGPPTNPKTASVICHEFLHTIGLRDLTADRTNRAKDGRGNDIDIMGGAMHNPLAMLAIGPDDLRQIRDENRSQYRSGFAPHSLPLSSFGPNMPDWDTLQVSEQRGACPPDRVRVTLALGQGITWWKGLTLCRRDRSGNRELIGLQDNNRTATVEVRVEDLRSNDFVLGKAKVFGVHTNMYCVEDANVSMRGGNAYTFTWVKD